MEEFLADFLVECNESLARLDQDLVTLEKNPQNIEVLKDIFRVIHSIKGACAMFGFKRLERISHAAEDVLGEMRSGALPVSPEAIGPILNAVDIIKDLLVALETQKTEPDGDDSAAIENLRRLVGGDAKSADSGPSAEYSANANTNTNTDMDMDARAGDSQPRSALSEQTLRVNVDVLDGLMNLIGELVLVRNQMVQIVQGDEESRYFAAIQQLNRITAGLQQSVMKTRMQAIGTVWSKVPRIVRDLSQSTGKQIEVVMTGQETEVDRQVLQAIQDPLLHCVRNSGDHGIETPEIRTSLGKPAHGTISLNAFHEGGHIIIEIKDDGAGINIERVLNEAIKRGLVREDTAPQMSESQIIKLIFEPGFSTAKQVTEISGRGVGMDVVRTNIEKMGGSVEAFTQAGLGTTFRIKIPLTLAIISALIVNVGGGPDDVFAIPQVGVVELVRITGANQGLVEAIHGSRVLRLRDRLLPLIDLASVLGIQPPENRENNDEFSIVVAQVNDFHLGLIVHEIFDTQEIVVKPVGRLLRDINLFAGSTILGNGRVVIILDTLRVASKALPDGIHSCVEAIDQAAAASTKNQETEDKTSLVLFRGVTQTPLAVPLALVARLEEFPAERIERVEGRYMIQYRGGLLPLIPCHDTLLPESFTDGKIPAIIFSDGSRSMGLIVSEILDIIEQTVHLEQTGRAKGVLGAAIVGNKATEIIDTYHYLHLAYPNWVDEAGASPEAV